MCNNNKYTYNTYIHTYNTYFYIHTYIYVCLHTNKLRSATESGGVRRLRVANDVGISISA